MALERFSAQRSYAEVLERVLDKGIVMDASVRISVVGVELVRIDAWVVVASIETYLQHGDLMKKIVAPSETPHEIAPRAGPSEMLVEPEP